ncbi:MAG: dihydroorotate dehydrogenase [Acidimicrobiia bacterium]|nr:dihydroorotate dehydrogenase [Acidimicrobiia bacterium]
MKPDLSMTLGSVPLRSPIVAAAGTVGSVFEFADVTDWSVYGAAVAKSVSGDPWQGRPAPRVAPAGVGMLNGIGIQNPGIDAWVDSYVPRFRGLGVPVWGSAVGNTVDEFVRVASGMAAAGIDAIEINLSCPNLDGHLFALDPKRAAEVVAAIRGSVSVPLGAKLSPNSEDVVAVAGACAGAGADWVVLTNTVWGAGVDVTTRRPKLTGMIGGYSGPPLKPIALRCVLEVARAMPDLPIVGCGGVSSAEDVLEFVVAGASAVGVGTAHFADPRVGTRIIRTLSNRLRRMGVARLKDLVGTVEPW